MVTEINSKAGKNVRFSLYNGDTWKVQFVFTDLDGNSVDLTGADVLLQIKKTATATTSAYELTEEDGLTIVGNNIFINKTIDFLRSRYYYDLQITLGAGYRFSGAYGVIYVQRDISKDVTPVSGIYDAIEYDLVPVQLNVKIKPADGYLLINDTDYLLINDTDKLII